MARQADPRIRALIAKNLKRRVGSEKIDDVARRMREMPPSQLSGYLHAHRGFSIETLLRMAAGLNCSLDDLVYGVDTEYTRNAAKRQHQRELGHELEQDQDLLDVVTGFEAIRLTNPAEAQSIADMFRARLRTAAAPAPARGGSTDAASTGGAGTTRQSHAPTPARRRKRVG